MRPRQPVTWTDYLLRLYCTALGVVALAYCCLEFAHHSEVSSYSTVSSGFALLALGWLLAFARNPEHHQLGLCGASLGAIPFSLLALGVMHDISIIFPVLEHHRWCFPEEGTWITTSTASWLLFVPLALVSIVRWTWARGAHAHEPSAADS